MFFKGLYGHIADIKANMPKQAQKHTILGGIKVSSKQLSEWGKIGGRPKQWTNEAERKRAERLRKKQAKFGEKAELREYRSYGEIQIKKISITCPSCGKVETDLRKYFDEKGGNNCKIHSLWKKKKL